MAGRAQRTGNLLNGFVEFVRAAGIVKVVELTLNCLSSEIIQTWFSGIGVKHVVGFGGTDGVLRGRHLPKVEGIRI